MTRYSGMTSNSTGKSCGKTQEPYRPCRILSVVFPAQVGDGEGGGTLSWSWQGGQGVTCPGPGLGERGGTLARGGSTCPGPGWGEGGGTLSWSWPGVGQGVPSPGSGGWESPPPLGKGLGTSEQGTPSPCGLTN